MTVEAYGEAYQRWFNSTISLLLSRGAKIESAREAAQAAWAKGWEHIGQLRDEGSVRTWVNSIALNCFRNFIRVENHHLPLTEAPTADYGNLDAVDLERFLAWCRPGDRRLFEDYLEGYATEEIAHRQCISCTAARIRLLRARRAVQSRITGRGAPSRRRRSLRERAH